MVRKAPKVVLTKKEFLIDEQCFIQIEDNRIIVLIYIEFFDNQQITNNKQQANKTNNKQTNKQKTNEKRTTNKNKNKQTSKQKINTRTTNNKKKPTKDKR